MPKKAEVCSGCGCECGGIPCAAFYELQKIYKETRTKEKRQLTHRLRSLISIADAEPANDIKLLAQKIIKKLPELHHIRDCGINVGYVRSFEQKIKSGRSVYADCRKVNKVYGAFLPYDFIITVYEPNTEHLTDNQMKILIWHELKHIGIGAHGFIIEPHDIEEFYSILDSHGAKWGSEEAEVIDILE